MKVFILSEKEIFALLNDKHNQPDIQNQKEENKFQSEIRALYDRLIIRLSTFGEEGDYGDFAVRPDLRIRSTVMGLAPHIREFAITILTEEFFRSNYIEALYDFLTWDARAYRVVVDQHVNLEWTGLLILTSELAQICYTNSEERIRLCSTLAELS